MIIKITDINDERSPAHGMQERSIYLKKDSEIIGLHEIGYDNETWTEEAFDGTRSEKKGFSAMERWGNEYDDSHKMLGRGSFRVHEDIEKVAEELELDGWICYEGPTQK